ncbi:MAG TPA: helix-turn-helix domain-containing protein [Candidatus Brocadiia bacterium]|nr:helix-turn-helix domain-containing protein [Candidatus Brocadiia bacterium]
MASADDKEHTGLPSRSLDRLAELVAALPEDRRARLGFELREGELMADGLKDRMKDNPALRVYSLQEIADAYGMGKRTLRLHVKQGRLRARRIGRELMVTEADLAAYLAGDGDKASGKGKGKR